MILKCISSGSKGNSYALIAEKEILLLECGMPLMDVKKAIGFEIGKVVGCIATHMHNDHIRYHRDFLAAGIEIFSNYETADYISIITGEWISETVENKRFRVGGFKVTPFYVPHNDTPNFAYLIEHAEAGKLLFATDYEYLPFTFKKHRLNHMLIECNYNDNYLDREIPNYEHKIRGHASLRTCKGIVEANRTADLQNFILCHLGGSCGPREEIIAEVQKVAGNGVYVCVAEAGMSVELVKKPF